MHVSKSNTTHVEESRSIRKLNYSCPQPESTDLDNGKGLRKENEEWILIGRVIDRVCFLIMFSLFILGSIGTFMAGHYNQAPSQPFPGDPKLYLPLLEGST
ncbi:unnamed protein product [Ranitomeya imitator]|uniref:Uncharacterized protein n=1 Tax=Ranitomeya imitator TaxID=111125 RepID=A0ABN9LZI9_9NEOB|nr:unnamed protein product [Ranitomeya imitator]